MNRSKKKCSRSRCVDIRLENVAVAATHVVGAPSRCSNKGVKRVDVYRTAAKIILFVNVYTARACLTLTGPLVRQNSIQQAMFGGIYIYEKKMN